VDFNQLKIAASKAPGVENYAIVVGPVTQKEFLERSQAEFRLKVKPMHVKEYIHSYWYVCMFVWDKA
jgi:hypothetical protein